MTRILVIDNYDSFVYTLNGYLRQLGADTTVIRNDAITAEELPALLSGYQGVLVSPGPGKPSDAGISLDAIRFALATGMPLLGVCLGHQAIAEVLGATVTNAEELVHGKTSRVQHTGVPFFSGVPTTFTATRYHSLAVIRETVPEQLTITAETAQGIVMAVQHTELPIFGVQYHPESVLTEGGYVQLGNWLTTTGATRAADIAATLSPLVATERPGGNAHTGESMA